MAPEHHHQKRRPVFRSLWRGGRRRCPSCGLGRFFSGYLRLSAGCDRCAEPLGQIRSDDIPPYFTILIVGHIVVPLMLLTERHAPLPLWTSFVIWPLLTLALTSLFLPAIKGASVGLMWALKLRGDERQ